MKAAVYTRYGSADVVQVREMERPVPKDDEVLIKIRAASINPADWRLMKGPPRIFRVLFRLPEPTAGQPHRIGLDAAGEVESVGKDVTQFKAGDEVFGACAGSLAEYACITEAKLAPKPENLTFEQAAAVPVAALTALQGLRDKGKLQPGQRVLINGAAGGVGTFAVQIAKALDAEVTGVCSAKNAEMVRSLGADRVIDYAQEDFTESSQRYDLILDNVGNHSIAACRGVLNRTGICVLVGAPKGGEAYFLIRSLLMTQLSRFLKRKTVFLLTKMNREDLLFLRERFRSRKITPVIDRCYKLSEAAEAIRYLGEGHARAKVVIIPSA